MKEKNPSKNQTFKKKPLIPPNELKRQPGESRKEESMRIDRLIADNWVKALDASWRPSYKPYGRGYKKGE